MLPSRRGVLRLGESGVAAAMYGLVAGCSAPSDDSVDAPAGERILALGDSYTIGTSVSPEERWVTKLVDQRRGAGHTVAEPRVIAENGWTTGDLDEAIDDAEDGTLVNEYGLVTLLIGANNCFQGQDPGTFHPKFVAMLKRAIGFAPNPEKVVVISVPDYTLTPVGQRNNPEEQASRLSAYNNIIEEEAAAAGTQFADVVPPSKEVTDRPELIAEDDLHPSGEQYDLWLERIYPIAIEALAH